MTPHRCFIHAGLPKTGTSFLQSVFWSSRKSLGDAGLRVLMDRRDNFHATLALRGMLDPDMDPRRAFGAFDRLVAAAAEPADRDVLFSQESLAPATEEEAKRLVGLFSQFEVHVVLTARDLARQISSGWQQRIQERQVHSYEDFLTAVVARAPLADDFWLNQDLVASAEHWSSSVTPQRLHIVTVPPSGSDKNLLLARFCAVMGIDPAVPSLVTPQGNESLGLVQAELLRRVSLALGERLPHPRSGFGRVGKGYLAHRVLAPQGGQPPVLPAALSDWCEQTSAGVVGRLRAADYDISGDLDDLLPAVAAGRDPVVSEEALIGSAVEALATILEDRHRELQELGELRAAARRHRDSAVELSAEPPAGRLMGPLLRSWARSLRRLRSSSR